MFCCEFRPVNVTICSIIGNLELFCCESPSAKRTICFQIDDLGSFSSEFPSRETSWDQQIFAGSGIKILIVFGSGIQFLGNYGISYEKINLENSSVIPENSSVIVMSRSTLLWLFGSELFPGLSRNRPLVCC